MLSGTIDFLLDLRLGGIDDALAFRLGIVLRFLDQFAGTFFCMCQNLTGLLTRLLQFLGDPLRCQLQLLPAFFGGREAIGNLLLTVLHRLLQRRPDVFHGQPDEYSEPQRLAK